MFVIVDQAHDAWGFGEFESLPEALVELERLAEIPWDAKPNVAPCTAWRECGRDYAVVEYDRATGKTADMTFVPYLRVSKDGVVWLQGH